MGVQFPIYFNRLPRRHSQGGTNRPWCIPFLDERAAFSCDAYAMEYWR